MDHCDSHPQLLYSLSRSTTTRSRPQCWSDLSGDYSVLGDYLVTHWKKKNCQLALAEDYTHQSWREANHLKLLMRQRMFLTQLISFLEKQTTLIGQNCGCFEKIMRSWEWELSLFIRSFMWWTSYQLKHANSVEI